jgi:hypothetical protein
MLGRSPLAVALLLSAGCSHGDRASTEQEARAVADTAMAVSAHPSEKPSVKALDMGNRWRFYYSFGGVGGGVIIVVNKHSGEVVHSEADQ